MNTTAWTKATLGEFFRLKHGFAFKGEFFANSGPYVLLTPGNFRADGGLEARGEREKYYVGEFPHEYLLKQGELLIVLTDLTQNAPILGSPAIIPKSGMYLHNQRLGKVMGLDESKLKKKFLYHLLNTANVREQIKATATGSTVRHTAPDRVCSVRVTVPDPSTQQRIADILSAYDDLIENNTRRIKILEQMAQMLYREWFVNFRFLGHEKVKMVESELGLIPDGWTVKPLGDVATITMGLSPKGDTYNEDGSGVPLINGPVEFGERFARAVKWTTAPSKLCREGDLIVCVRGSTTGRYVKSDASYCLGRGVCALSSKYQCFVDLLFQDQLPTLLAQTSGSTFPSWTGPQLKSHPVHFPSVEVLDHFETLARPLSAAVFTFSRQIHNLRTTRDLLLPKLVSGEIELPEVESALLGATA